MPWEQDLQLRVVSGLYYGVLPNSVYEANEQIVAISFRKRKKLLARAFRVVTLNMQYKVYKCNIVDFQVTPLHRKHDFQNTKL